MNLDLVKMKMESSNPGPVDASVLYEQERHVSSAVWEGQERGALRCHEHTSKLGEWRLTPRQVHLVDRAGFGHFRRIPAISLDNPLISALVERWRRETNTFHFTLGEMTLTLQDVALLLGLSIDGKAVIGVTHTTCGSVCLRLLGRVPDSNYASGGMVKLSWLKEFFSQLSEDASEEEVEQCTRAYLLYLVGSTIFSTTTGNKVPVMYLPLFEDFDESGNYAWGAAALAFLYRALGNACVKTQSTICGCLTLLQCWSYFHLNIGRPKLNHDIVHDQFPFVLRWKGKQSGPTANRDVVFYRKALDSLKPIDVDWLPYKYMDSTVIPEDIRKTLIFGRSKTMLICFDKAERHLPNRCLRQFGMSQPIPEDVEKWLRKSRGVDGGVDLSGKMETELNEWVERQLHIVDGDDDGDESEYMEWYLKITRKVVGRPISLSSEFQRTISGLKEISFLADSFSTKGLDGQQFDSISRIRFIAQDCLRDQTASPATPPALPPVELGKRVRGKEKIRKKGSGKRRRKDDPMEDQETSDDDQLPSFGVVIGMGQLQFRQADGEIGQLPFRQASTYEVDHTQLYDLKGDEAGELHRVSKVDDALPGATDNFRSSQTHEVENKADHPHPSEATDKNDTSHLSGGIAMVYDYQCSSVADDVKDSQICDAIADEVGCQPHSELNESHICQARSTDVDVSETGDIGTSIYESPRCDTCGDNSSEFQPLDATKKLDEPYLVRTDELIDTKLHPVTLTNKDNETRIFGTSKEDSDSQLPCDVEKEPSSSQITESEKEVQNLKLPDSAEEMNKSIAVNSVKEVEDLVVPDAAKEINSQPADETDETSDLQNPGDVPNGPAYVNSSEKVIELHPDAVKEDNTSPLPSIPDLGNHTQLPDRAPEVDNSQVPHKPSNEQELLAFDETKDENGFLPSDITKSEPDGQASGKPGLGRFSELIDKSTGADGSFILQPTKEPCKLPSV